MTRPPRWIAARDGIAHAHLPGGRTLCGTEPIAPRYAWPESSRCPACVRLAEPCCDACALFDAAFDARRAEPTDETRHALRLAAADLDVRHGLSSQRFALDALADDLR